MSKSETSICELPPLPKGDIAADTCPVMWVHTDQQIENYALAAIEPYKQRIEELEAELQELRWQWVEHDTLGCPTAKTGIYAIDHARRVEGGVVMSKWVWMMDWCRSRGLPPASEEVWKAAENSWESHTFGGGK